MESNQFRNLFATEEWIQHTLKNAQYQSKFYLTEIEKASSKALTADQQEKLSWYKKVFEYYRDDLVPALLESAALEEKHIEIINRNPDPKFGVLRSEVEYHQNINKKFFHRFEEIHREFHGFVKSL